MSVGARLRRWRVPALLLLAAETAALFWAYYALSLGTQIQAAERAPLLRSAVGQVLASIEAIMPTWVFQILSGIPSILSLPPGFQAIAAVGPSLGAGLSLSSGSALVAPAYFAARRLLRPDPRSTARAPQRASHWKIRPARVPEPMEPVATGIRAAAPG